MPEFQIKSLDHQGAPHAIETAMSEIDANKRAELLTDWGHTEVTLIDSLTGAEQPFIPLGDF